MQALAEESKESGAVSNTGEKWLQVEGKDISSYGNVLKIKAGDLEQMKQTVIDNNWSSVTFLANGEAQFKKFYFQLNQTHLSKSKAADSIWIYNPDGHQAGRKTTDIDLKHWIRVEGKNLAGFDTGNPERVTTVDKIKELAVSKQGCNGFTIDDKGMVRFKEWTKDKVIQESELQSDEAFSTWIYNPDGFDSAFSKSEWYYIPDGNLPEFFDWGKEQLKW